MVLLLALAALELLELLELLGATLNLRLLRVLGLGRRLLNHLGGFLVVVGLSPRDLQTIALLLAKGHLLNGGVQGKLVLEALKVIEDIGSSVLRYDSNGGGLRLGWLFGKQHLSHFNWLSYCNFDLLFLRLWLWHSLLYFLITLH